MKKLPPGEVGAKDVAYLTDWVLLAEGKPQRFGTQFEKDATGKWVPKRLDDPGHADERRRGVGLESLADYARRMSEVYDGKWARFRSRWALRRCRPGFRSGCTSSTPSLRAQSDLDCRAWLSWNG